MSTAPAEKTVYYRRARFSESMTRTAQQMVSDALSRLSHVRDRLEATDSQATEFRVISASRSEGAFLCGRLTTFARGGFQLVVADDPNATNLPLAAIEPPSREGVQQQFATGILYFCIFQDHVAVVQSAGLKAGGFEQHLAWLLRDKTGILTPQQGVALSDEPQKATRERIRRAHVKRVMLGRPLLQDSVIVPAESPNGKAQTRFKGTGPLLELFRGWIDDKQFERLGLDEGVFDGNLEVWIEIRHPKRSRSHTEDSVRLLDDLALALRDVDEDQTRLELADGTRVMGDQLKISTKVSVPVNDGLIDEASLYQEMRNWLEALIRDGAVSD